MKGHPLIWTEAEKKIILENYKTLQKKEIVVKLREELGVERTVVNLKCFYCKFHLNSGMTGYFVKGEPPHNKGQKMSPELYEKIKATMFKKGHRPHNTHPVGTEIYQLRDGRKKKNSYWFVKVAEPDVWEMKHRFLWESVNGPIPPGMKLMFIDGDTNNITIENLRLVSNADCVILNHGYGDKELTPEEKNIIIDVIQIGNKAKQRTNNL